jgi:hypothetical protein
MEPDGSLSCSQKLSTGPHREPDESSPYHKNYSNLNEVQTEATCINLTKARLSIDRYF